MLFESRLILGKNECEKPKADTNFLKKLLLIY